MADGDSPAGQGKGQPHRLTRRRALGASAAAAAGASLGGLTNGAALARERRRPMARDGRFEWGVSSGLPTPRAIVVWTRVGGLDRSSQIQLEVARDRHFRKVVERRRVTAAEEPRLHRARARQRAEAAARVLLPLLHPQVALAVGRFRTLPPADSNEHDPDRLLLLPELHGRLLQRPRAGSPKENDLDLVVCLGDYIYENATYEGPRQDTHRRQRRRRRAEARRVPRRSTASTSPTRNLQEMHAAHPFVAVWDDHEVEDNYAGDQASSSAEPA